MSALSFKLRAPPPQRLDLSALVPARLAGLDQAAIERLPIGTTRAPLAVGEAFAVRMGEAASIAFEGGSERFDNVGAGLDGGDIVLEGDAGLFAGRGMTAGRLEIRGNAGAFAASGLKGGCVEIGGDVQEHLGGPAAGKTRGVSGGVVVVRGRAGARAGDRMRRGLIVIEGDAGEFAAARMIAGTVVICGAAGRLPGYLMRRGTLLIGGAAEPPPTFVAVGGTTEVFAALLARALAPLSRLAAGLAEVPWQRLAGDMATLGRGEMLLPRQKC
jgi:formylmethanofuran dehydrogenase subunit C